MTTDLKETDAKPLGKRIRLLLEELGPTFVKLGQLLSLRPDLIPEQITKELELLQDKVPPADEVDIKTVILSELGAPAQELFADFDEHCLAAASIGQVYRAVLKTGEAVVVKIRRPHIEKLVNNDIEILWDLATLVEHRYSWAKQYIKCAISSKNCPKPFKTRWITFRKREIRKKIYKQFEHDENIIIPKIYWDYCSKQVLTIEYIEGKKYADLLKETEAGFDKKIIAERLVRSFLDQVLIAGVYHGDPHPGNLFFLPGNKIAYIDFGQVGVLSQDMKQNFSKLIIGLMKGDIDLLNQTIHQMAIMPESIDEITC
ncbi:AarF/UbiB family protein [Terrilactibacillus sp. S3-3]|nr:AarF/UbiB family protein [Terrilactibacillus sp. S3-3]